MRRIVFSRTARSDWLGEKERGHSDGGAELRVGYCAGQFKRANVHLRYTVVAVLGRWPGCYNVHYQFGEFEFAN